MLPPGIEPGSATPQAAILSIKLREPVGEYSMNSITNLKKFLSNIVTRIVYEADALKIPSMPFFLIAGLSVWLPKLSG